MVATDEHYNEFGCAVDNDTLTPEDIPAADAPYWGVIDRFALTYDGYSHLCSFEQCADIGNAAADEHQASGGLPESLDALRTCLFFEQRRWRHFDEHPDDATMEYIRALVEAIRRCVD